MRSAASGSPHREQFYREEAALVHREAPEAFVRVPDETCGFVAKREIAASARETISGNCAS